VEIPELGKSRADPEGRDAGGNRGLCSSGAGRGPQDGAAPGRRQGWVRAGEQGRSEEGAEGGRNGESGSRGKKDAGKWERVWRELEGETGKQDESSGELKTTRI